MAYFLFRGIPFDVAVDHGFFNTPDEVEQIRRQAEQAAALIQDSIPDAVWADGLSMIDMLISMLMPPPVDLKNGKIKKNLMAQNVASSFARLSLTDVVATDLDPDRLKEALVSGKVLSRKDGKLLKFIPSSRLSKRTRSRMQPVEGTEVEKTEFAQVKYVNHYRSWAETANNVFQKEEFLGVRPFDQNISDDHIRAVAAIQAARRSGMMEPEQLRQFVEAMVRIRDGLGMPSDMALLRWFRPAIYEGSGHEVFDLAHNGKERIIDLGDDEGVVGSPQYYENEIILRLLREYSRESSSISILSYFSGDSIMELVLRLGGQVIGYAQARMHLGDADLYGLILDIKNIENPGHAAQAFVGAVVDEIITRSKLPLRSISVVMPSDSLFRQAVHALGFTENSSPGVFVFTRETRAAA
jgi:hypothetical protein